MDNHHDPHQRRVFPAELSPVTPPPAYSRSRQYAGDAEPPLLRPTNSFPVGGAYSSHHIRYPFELNRSSYRRMSEPEAPITVHENDVLMGRGGKNNQHSGNEKLRQLARGQAANYRSSTKKGKSAISRDLVDQMQNLNPPARFLKRSTNGDWEDVGTDVAREKASQVLRDAVALLPEETEGNHAEEDDDEPIAMHSAAPAAVTQDEMDRRPVAGMGPPQQPHVTPGLSTASSFPPASPMEQSRKRHRDYYHQDYAPQPYHHHSYHTSRHEYPPHHHHSYQHESPTQRPRYGRGQTHYPEYPGSDDPYSPTRSWGSSSHHYSQAQYHQRGSSAASLSPPRRQQPYPPSMPHSHPGYARSHTSVGDFFPPPSSMPSPHHRRRTSAPEPSQQQRQQYQQQGSSPPESQHQQPIPYHPRASHSQFGSPTRYPATHSQPPHGYPLHQHPSPVIARRPQAVGEGYRQQSTASAHSLLGDVAAGVDPNNGVNEFDLFNGELLASDTENSPRQWHPQHHNPYPGYSYAGHHPSMPHYHQRSPYRYPPQPPTAAQQQEQPREPDQPQPRENDEGDQKPSALESAALEQQPPPSLGAAPSVDEVETQQKKESE